MRSKVPKGLKITLIQDSQSSKDLVIKLMNSSTLHPGSDREPVPSPMNGPDCWVYKDKVFSVENAETISEEELKLRLKHDVFKREKEIQQIRREVEAFENFDKLPSARREQIPASVRMFVWQRDGGRCIECRSKERLEFDHIIPFVEGGATTERNVQLLCEACNRKKGRRI